MNDELKDHLAGMEQRLLEKLAGKEELAEIGEAVHALATHMDARFDEIDQKLDPLSNQVLNHENRIKFIEDRLPKLART